MKHFGNFQQKYIREIEEKRENDRVRPIRKAKEYIQNHYGEPITLEEVSSEVGLSPTYFSVLFKKSRRRRLCQVPDSCPD